jgi:4-aminobutyrate--pyruvate transaminase
MLSNLAVRDIETLIHPYTQLAGFRDTGPLVLERGEGVWVYDTAGKAYLEGMSGLWCTSLGHGNAELAEVAAAQMKKLAFSPLFSGKSHDPAIELAETLKAIAPVPISKVFFCNSGSEANDTQIKLVWYMNNALGRPQKKKIVSRAKAYHGVTIASASLTRLPVNQTDFDLPIDRVIYTGCPHHYRFAEPGESEEDFATRLADEFNALIEAERPDTVAAFIAEPVMGAGGMIVPPPSFWPRIRAVCDKYGVLLIADEVVTGFGRTGHMFGTRLWGVQADMWCLAKGISSGYVPLGATAVSAKVAEVFSSSDSGFAAVTHGYTYSAHPVAAAAALATLDILEREDILGNVRTQGAHLLKRLQALGERSALIGDVRGTGLMVAIEMVADKKTKAPLGRGAREVTEVAREAYRLGAMVRTSGPNIILSPALTISRDEVDFLCDMLEASFTKVGGPGR